MKTPITYYGGKTNMLGKILPLIPGDHRTFVEPFFGGGAVFFGKQPSQVEVINDNLDMAVTFYRVAKTRFDKLKERIGATLHAEADYLLSREILKNPGNYDEVERAWAFWAQCQLTGAYGILRGFGFNNSNLAGKTAYKVSQFDDRIEKRLKNAQIFCRDALDVIRIFDGPETFFYLDPPYANSDCGHYKQGKDVFYRLLEVLPTLKGRWLLSSYPCEQLDELRKMPGIYSNDRDQPLAVAGKHNAGKRKTECLTLNYQLDLLL